MLSVFCFETLLKMFKHVCLTLAVKEKKEREREKSFHQFLLVQQCYGAAEPPPHHVTFQIVSKVTEAPVF